MFSRNPTHRPNNVGAFQPRIPAMLKKKRVTDTSMLMPARPNVVING